MNQKVLLNSFLFLLAQFMLEPAVAAGASPHKCPPELLAAPDITLTNEYPHFLINYNNTTDDSSDDFYQLCKDARFTQCKPFTEFTPGDGNGLIIIGTLGTNIIRSSQYDDKVCGMGGNDIISGGKGNDILYGNAGSDVIEGKEGNDTLYGGKGKDGLYGMDKKHINLDYISLDPGTFGQTIPGTDNDIIYGGRGLDTLGGGPHRDVMLGENGNDILNGGKGDDAINGGPGTDNCVDVDGEGINDCASSSLSD